MPNWVRIFKKVVTGWLVLSVAREIPHFTKREEEPSIVRAERNVPGEHTSHEYSGFLNLQASRPVAVATPTAAPPFVDNSAMLDAANQAVFARRRALRDHPVYYTQALSSAPAIWYAATSSTVPVV